MKYRDVHAMWFPPSWHAGPPDPPEEDDMIECVDNPDECRGPVEYHSIDPGRDKAWPRCEKHWGERLDRHNDPSSLARYAYSDVPPPGFDPADVGERWDDDY